MGHVITSFHIDAKFDIATPPLLTVQFTDRDPVTKAETPGMTRFADAAAKALLLAVLSSKTPQGMLDAIGAAIDAQAAALAPPTALADKITAAADAEQRARVANATTLAAADKLAAVNTATAAAADALATANAATAAANSAAAAATAQLKAINDQIAAKTAAAAAPTKPA